MSNLARMSIISFVTFMSMGIPRPISSLYVAALGANYVEIGLLGTVISLTVIVFGFVRGQASDRLGVRKAFLVAGLAAMAPRKVVDWSCLFPSSRTVPTPSIVVQLACPPSRRRVAWDVEPPIREDTAIHRLARQPNRMGVARI